jgi:glycosyltransferase involved in cell wall biosynthesis
MELTILMPCLNEALTIKTCIEKAKGFLKRMNIQGEILVADNGSTDGSQKVAEACGARVVHVSERGYGAALREGIAQAQGVYVVMGDSDDSYDFSRLDHFVNELRAGHDLVVGNRFKGGIQDGAMPWLHRYLGNPVLSWIGRSLFNTRIKDFHCGLRGLRRDKIQSLGLKSSGMEFASEMIMMAAFHGLSIVEVPTTLMPDGRNRPPHLRTWRDGWRHLIFMLIHSPRAVFMWPGVVLALVGALVASRLFHGPQAISEVVFDIHTLLFGAAALIGGVQLLFMGILLQIVGDRLGIWSAGRIVKKIADKFHLELGLSVGAALICIALAMSWRALSYWGDHDYSAIDPVVVMRIAIPAVMSGLAGLQIMMFGMVMALIVRSRK